MRTIALAILLLLSTAAAGAAPPDPDDPTITIDFGWGGQVVSGRWMPITVHVTCAAKPFEGILSVEYTDEGNQTSRIVRPVAGTPNKTISVPVLVNLPSRCSEMTFMLLPPAGRAVAIEKYNVFPRSGERQLPFRTISDPPIIVAIADAGGGGIAPESAALLADKGLVAESAAGPRDSAACSVAFASLPTVWAAYDGLLMLITDATTPPSDPRALAAVREWVLSGGRLVILATKGGDDWRRWFGPGDPPIAIEDPATLPIPQSLQEALHAKTFHTGPAPQTRPAPARGGRSQAERAKKKEAAAQGPTEPPDKEAEPANSQPVPDFHPAATAPQRRLNLTAAGQRAGWIIRWSGGESDQSGDLAEGPIGFGWVTVLGVDPRRVSDVVLSRASRAVWSDALSMILADFRESVEPQQPGIPVVASLAVPGSAAWSPGSDVLSRVCDVPLPRTGVFIILAAVLGSLALLIGPVDALLLRALRMRHRSWATAIGWIALTTLIAYAAPRLGKSSETIVNRISVVDCLLPADSKSGAASGEPLVWRTSVTGVFASATFQQTFTGAIEGSWWKGLSSNMMQNFDRPARAGPVTQTEQSLADLGALGGEPDAWGGFRPDAPGRGSNLLAKSTPFRVWTQRAFTDQARTKDALGITHVQAEQVGGACRLRLALPQGARISRGGVRIGERWFQIDTARTSTSGEQTELFTLNAAAIGVGASKHPGWAAWDSADWKEAAQNSVYRLNPSPGVRPANWMGLSGPDRRTQAINTMVARGQYAGVYLLVENLPPDVSFERGGIYHCSAALRLVVPLEETSGTGVPPVRLPVLDPAPRTAP